MLKKQVLGKTHFIPMKHMHTVIDFLKAYHNPYLKKMSICENNLYLLQRTRFNTFEYSVFGKSNWLTMFTLACHKALYAHDWDKLLYLLKKVPKWKIIGLSSNLARPFDIVYTRYLTILLMYHPSSQAQGLLCEYLHMTWGCRGDKDKKAVLKVLLHLPKKLPPPLISLNTKTIEHDSD